MTSHGKSECDGIGGTIKREAHYFSLKQTCNNQILTPIELFNFCVEKIKNITFFYVEKEETKNMKLFLKPRFQCAKSIKGTRKFHSFVPLNDHQLRLKRFCKDDVYENHSICKNPA